MKKGLFDTVPGAHRNESDIPYAAGFAALRAEVAADVAADPETFASQTVEATGLDRAVVGERLAELLRQGFDRPGSGIQNVGATAKR